MGKLQGKVAVITGGTSGIGLATAKRFVAEGAHVFIMGRRRAELDTAVKQIGAKVTGVQGDIAKLADLDRLYQKVKETEGGIDVIFANAGVGEVAPLGAISTEHFDQVFNVNVRGTLFTVQKALPLLRNGGSIILTGSIASVKGLPGFGVYSASKAAIRSFVRTWTLELKDRKIRANVISPGTIDTPILAGLPKEPESNGSWTEALHRFSGRCAPLTRSQLTCNGSKPSTFRPPLPIRKSSSMPSRRSLAWCRTYSKPSPTHRLL
jgi:NAD(P)-dependent dehydrogenase (short-subunit alcohol dehydrogenase family)